MAEERKEQMVGVVYRGTGGTSPEIAEYRDGQANLNHGDEFQVPEEVANKLIFNRDFERADGVTVEDLAEYEERQAEGEDASGAGGDAQERLEELRGDDGDSAPEDEQGEDVDE